MIGDVVDCSVAVALTPVVQGPLHSGLTTLLVLPAANGVALGLGVPSGERDIDIPWVAVLATVTLIP